MSNFAHDGFAGVFTEKGGKWVKETQVAEQLGELIKTTTTKIVETHLRAIGLNPQSMSDDEERTALIKEASKLQQCLHHLLLALEALR